MSSESTAALFDQGTEPNNTGASELNPSVSNKPDTRSSSDADHAKAGDARANEDADETIIEPTLRRYFAPEAVRVSAFVKALKDAKVHRFGAADTLDAEGLIAENDRDGARLWQLVANASTLDPVSAWVWPFIQKRVNILVGAQVDLSGQSAAQIIRSVVTAVSGSLHGEDKGRSKRAENDLRLAIAWLLEYRNGDVADIAEQVCQAFVDAKGSADGLVRKAMAFGSKVELQAILLAFDLAGHQTRHAKQERDFERRERFDLKAALDGLREESARRSETIRRLELERAELERLLEEERKKAESDRRHHAHSSSQTRADFSTSLQRVKGLVEEAGEAVQIAMKRADEGSLRGLQAAERRIMSAVDAISGIGK
ncbi:hypothetical protein [Sinorhizobium meliloti]